MKLDLNSISLVVQVFTAILSVLFFIKHKNYFLLLTMILFVSLTTSECIAAYLRSQKIVSFWFHFVYLFIEFSLISIIYYKLLKSKKKSLFYFIYLFFLVVFVFVSFNKSIFPYLIIFKSIVISFYTFLYLRGLLLSNEILNYKKLLPFWVSVAFLVFNISSIPFFTFFKYMADRNLFYILHMLIIIMNVIVIFGYLYSDKKKIVFN